MEAARGQVFHYLDRVLACQPALGGQLGLQHESQRAQLRAQRLGQARKIIATGKEDVGISAFLAFVDVGKHARHRGMAPVIVRETARGLNRASRKARDW